MIVSKHLLMKSKKKDILTSALTLFSSNGFHRTSTSKIAIDAGVSEALIFRHFGSKERLLWEVLNTEKTRLNKLFLRMALQDEPKEIIKTVLEFPFTVTGIARDYWKMVQHLRWEGIELPGDLFDSLLMVLNGAFKALRYKNPKMESELLLVLVHGISAEIFLNPELNSSEMVAGILEKYNIKPSKYKKRL